MKISTVHHENLGHSSWKCRPFIMKMSTVHHENLDRSSWKSRPFIMKISTVHHENLGHSSWKSRLFIMKISTVHHENLGRSSWKSRPFIMKISTVHHKNLARSSWKSRPFIIKISTVLHENLDHSSWKSRPFVIKPRPFIMKSQLLAKMAFQTNVRMESFVSVQSKRLCRRKKIVWSSIFYSKEWRKAIIHRTNVLILFNDTHRGKLRFIQFSTRMAGWLLLTFFICLPYQLSSSINFIIMH